VKSLVTILYEPWRYSAATFPACRCVDVHSVHCRSALVFNILLIWVFLNGSSCRKSKWDLRVSCLYISLGAIS